LFTHSLYYADMSDVAEVLHTSPDRKAYGIIHRFDQREGELNMGELRYAVDADNVVTQLSAVTGQGYSHPNTSMFFTSNGIDTPSGALGWDVTKLCGDSFLVTIIPLDDPSIIMGRASTTPQTDEVITISVTKSVHVMSLFGMRFLRYTDQAVVQELREVEFFDKLRAHVAGRPRDAKVRNDLFAMARRMCQPTDVFSVHSGKCYKIPPGQLSLYVNAAFYADVGTELSAATAYAEFESENVKALNAVYSGTSTYQSNFESVTKSVGTLAEMCGIDSAKALVDGLLNLMSNEHPLQALKQLGLNSLADILTGCEQRPAGNEMHPLQAKKKAYGSEEMAAHFDRPVEDRTTGRAKLTVMDLELLSALRKLESVGSVRGGPPVSPPPEPGNGVPRRHPPKPK